MAEEAINVLCEKLGVTMEYLLPKTITYLQTSRVISLIILSIIIFLLSIIVAICIRKLKKSDDVFDDVFMAFLFVTCVVLLVIIGCWLASLHDVIITFSSPEISAIKFLIGKMK